MNIKPVSAVWDNESVRRFWNYLGQKTQMESEYFSFQVGKGIVRFLKRTGLLSRPVDILDFGCGPGFLLERFLDTGNKCSGFDFSDGSAAIVNKKFTGRNNWNGAISVTALPAPYADASFGLITFIETLEHLLDEMIQPTMQELHRLLRPGGEIFLTIPNDEKLDDSNVYCPFCNSEFHKVQHVRSYDRESISKLMSQYGFEVIYCKNIDLHELEVVGWGDRHKIKRSLKRICNTIADAIAPEKSNAGKYILPRCSAGPNLCVIAKKAGFKI